MLYRELSVRSTFLYNQSVKLKLIIYKQRRGSEASIIKLLFLTQSIYAFIIVLYPSNYSFIHCPPMNLPNYPCIHLAIGLHIHPYIHVSTRSSTYPSICVSIHSLVHHPPIYISIQPHIRPLVHPSTHPFLPVYAHSLIHPSINI